MKKQRRQRRRPYFKHEIINECETVVWFIYILPSHFSLLRSNRSGIFCGRIGISNEFIDFFSHSIGIVWRFQQSQIHIASLLRNDTPEWEPRVEDWVKLLFLLFFFKLFIIIVPIYVDFILIFIVCDHFERSVISSVLSLEHTVVVVVGYYYSNSKPHKNNDEWKIIIHSRLETHRSINWVACDRWSAMSAGNILLSEIIVYLYLLSIQNNQFCEKRKKNNPNSLLSLSLRDENEWEILCSSSTTWLMINLFTSIVIYDVRRIGFTDNEERKENAHAPIFGWMCSGLERTAKKSLYLFILVINVRITVISAFGTSSQMRIDTIFAVDIYIYIFSQCSATYWRTQETNDANAQNEKSFDTK